MRPRHWQVTVTGDRTDTARPEAAEASESDDDLVLVQACLRGHREAFDAIVERHQRQVYQLCYRFAGNHEDASDLPKTVHPASAGFSFKGNSAFTTWLYRIGVNVCLNRVSSRAPMDDGGGARSS
jgi:RNA polymerase sigma-70 factor (ECF subfamily)